MSGRRVLGVVVAAVVLATGLGLPAHAQTDPLAPLRDAGARANPRDVIPDQYIVVMKSTVTPTAKAAVERAAIDHGGRVDHRYRRVLDGFDGVLTPAALTAIRRNPNVAYIEPVVRRHIADDQANPTWGLDRIDQRTLPLDHNFNYYANGSGVDVYVIDTGVRISHTEFGGRAEYGWDFWDSDSVADDCRGHGTHVAGTIAGTTSGVAKQTHIIALKVFPCPEGDTSSAVTIHALDWVYARASETGRPSVINISITGPPSSSEDGAVQFLIDHGYPVVVSAGNDNSDACNFSPARVGDAITVGNSNNADLRFYSDPDHASNWGSCVDLFAPGTDVVSASNANDMAHATMTGTSMAAPHVTGSVALYLQDHPSASPQQVRDATNLYATCDRLQAGQYGLGAGSSNRLLFAIRRTTPVDGAIGEKYWLLGGSGAVGQPLQCERSAVGGRWQDFQSAWIYWSPGTGAHEIRGAIRAKWDQLSREQSFLGYPTTDETTTPDGIGRYNHFQNGGSIYWSPGTGAHTVHGAIRAKWADLGWERSFLGYPTTDLTGTPDGIGYYNHFQNGGSIYWSPGTGAHTVHGAIRAKWADLGWERSFLGYPTTDITQAPDGVGYYNHFQTGSIYWSPATAAHEVHGAIRDKWAAMSWERSIGYPTTDETTTPDGIGRYNHFQTGSIYWTPSTGAHEVHGAIRDKWAAMSWERSIGYPTTDETTTPDGIGRYNHFQTGSIYWTPGTGAHEVHGAIRDRWAATGWERFLGYPTTDETRTPDGRGRYNHFSNNASIYWTPTTGAHAVYGVARNAWAAGGWEQGCLGYPTTEMTNGSQWFDGPGVIQVVGGQAQVYCAY